MSKSIIVLCLVMLTLMISSKKLIPNKRSFAENNANMLMRQDTKETSQPPAHSRFLDEMNNDPEEGIEGEESNNSEDDVKGESLLEEGMTVKEALKKIQMEKAEVQEMLNEMKAMMKTIEEKVQINVLDYIQWNGLLLGRRWKISEEGTNSYDALVFRDKLNTNAGNDRRYAMWPDRKTDL